LVAEGRIVEFAQRTHAEWRRGGGGTVQDRCRNSSKPSAARARLPIAGLLQRRRAAIAKRSPFTCKAQVLPSSFWGGGPDRRRDVRPPAGGKWLPHGASGAVAAVPPGPKRPAGNGSERARSLPPAACSICQSRPEPALAPAGRGNHRRRVP